MSLTPEQKAARLTGLGGSDAGAVAGVNPYSGPFDVWARFHVDGVGDLGGEPAEWGNALEPVIASHYARKTGQALAQVGTARHPKHRWMLGNVDRVVVGRRKLVEIKTAGIRQAHRWGDEGSDQVPEEYRLQVAHYLAVLDYDCADIAVLIGGQEFRIYHLERDRELEGLLVETEREFWEGHVVTGIAPPPGGSDRTRELLDRKHPSNTLPEFPPTSGHVDAAIAYDRARAASKVADDALSLARNRLVAAIGDASGFRWGKSKATWTNNKGGVETNWEAVAKSMGPSASLIAAHTHPKPGPRVLRVSVKE